MTVALVPAKQWGRWVEGHAIFQEGDRTLPSTLHHSLCSTMNVIFIMENVRAGVIHYICKGTINWVSISQIWAGLRVTQKGLLKHFLLGPTPGFWYSRAGVGPENLHFSSLCCSSRPHLENHRSVAHRLPQLPTRNFGDSHVTDLLKDYLKMNESMLWNNNYIQFPIKLAEA